MSNLVLNFLFLLASADILKVDDLKTVDYVDPTQYVGTWYQIARNPHPFEVGCVCSRQVLTPQQDGRIEVYNTCNDQTVNGALREIRGFATNVDPGRNAKFIVDFNIGRTGDYWIVGLDPQYRYAVVSDPSKYSLYILSKSPLLETALFEEAVAKAGEQIDTSKLSMTLQTGCEYP